MIFSKSDPIFLTLSGTLKQRYKRGDLWKLVRGNAVQFADFFLKSLGTSPPDNVVSMGLANLQSLSYFDSGGARYLWAYLMIVNFKLRRILTAQDFFTFWNHFTL